MTGLPGDNAKEKSNPYAQTLASQGAAPVSPNPAGPATQGQMLPAGRAAPGGNAGPSPQATAPIAKLASSPPAMLWATIGVVVVLLGLFAAFRIMTRDAEPPSKPASAAPAKTK